MSGHDGGSDGNPTAKGGTRETTADYDIDDVFLQLERLQETVTSDAEREEVERTRRMLKRVPGSEKIRKYTTRDVGESFVGGIVFALPLLVEDGVFEIAEWLIEVSIVGVPVFLAVNILFITLLTTGLLYAVDIRDVRITNPIFGLVPRRLVAVLAISFIVAAGTMFMWGRLAAPHDGVEPTALEQFARITVIWAAAALGAVLADILPGESKGEDISELISDEE